MTDDYMKEIYLLALHAKYKGQSKIPVYVFPFKMTDRNLKTYQAKYIENKDLISFWANLKIGYDKFIKEKKELKIKVAENGDYLY